MKGKKLLALLLTVAMLFTQFAMLGAVSAEEVAEFKFGVTGHQNTQEYQKNLDDMVYYAAEMGSKVIRIDLGRTGNADEKWWDRFFVLADKYGLDVIGIVYNVEEAKFFAGRYGDQLDYVQLHNEVDNPTILGDQYNGKEAEHYDAEKLAEWAVTLKALNAAVKETNPNIRTMVNFSWTHYYYVEYMLTNGLELDALGLDWYSRNENFNNETIVNTISVLKQKFNLPVWVAECNVMQLEDGANDEKMGDFIIDIYNKVKDIENVLGLIVYELFNEPSKSGAEAHYGLIEMNGDLTVKAPKQAYYGIQTALGFTENTVEKLVDVTTIVDFESGETSTSIPDVGGNGYRGIVDDFVTSGSRSYRRDWLCQASHNNHVMLYGTYNLSDADVLAFDLYIDNIENWRLVYEGKACMQFMIGNGSDYRCFSSIPLPTGLKQGWNTIEIKTADIDLKDLTAVEGIKLRHATSSWWTHNGDTPTIPEGYDTSVANVSLRIDNIRKIKGDFFAPYCEEEQSINVTNTQASYAEVSYPQFKDSFTANENLEYTVYASETPIDSGNIRSCGLKTTVTGALNAKLSGLTPETTYYLALEVKDETGYTSYIFGGRVKTKAEDIVSTTIVDFETTDQYRYGYDGYFAADNRFGDQNTTTTNLWSIYYTGNVLNANSTTATSGLRSLEAQWHSGSNWGKAFAISAPKDQVWDLSDSDSIAFDFYVSDIEKWKAAYAKGGANTNPYGASILLRSKNYDKTANMKAIGYYELPADLKEGWNTIVIDFDDFKSNSWDLTQIVDIQFRPSMSWALWSADDATISTPEGFDNVTITVRVDNIRKIAGDAIAPAASAAAGFEAQASSVTAKVAYTDNVTSADNLSYTLYASETELTEKNIFDCELKQTATGGSEVTLSGLKADSEYFVALEVADETGNVTYAFDEIRTKLSDTVTTTILDFETGEKFKVESTSAGTTKHEHNPNYASSGEYLYRREIGHSTTFYHNTLCFFPADGSYFDMSDANILAIDFFICSDTVLAAWNQYYAGKAHFILRDFNGNSKGIMIPELKVGWNTIKINLNDFSDLQVNKINGIRFQPSKSTWASTGDEVDTDGKVWFFVDNIRKIKELDRYIIDEDKAVTLDENGSADVAVDEKDVSLGGSLDLDVKVPAGVTGLTVALTDADGGAQSYNFTGLKEGNNLVSADMSIFTGSADLSAVTGYTVTGAAGAAVTINRLSAVGFVSNDWMYSGKTFNRDNQYRSEKNLTDYPLTFEARIKCASSLGSAAAGPILSNSGDKNYNATDRVSMEIAANGNPRLYFVENGVVHDYVFTGVNVYVNTWVHLAIVRDIENSIVKCYVDGVLRETLPMTSAASPVEYKYPLNLGSTYDEPAYTSFKGLINSASLYSDVRTDEEIAADVKAETPDTDNAIAAFDLSAIENNTIADLTSNGYDLKLLPFWYTEGTASDYAYTFAVVPDTQVVLREDPRRGTANFAKIYDYIVNNIESQNIRAVLGLGDITETDTADEWTLAKEHITKLDGKVPYLLARGNHDSTANLDSYLGTDTYKSQLSGTYDGSIANAYIKMTIGGVKYLIFTLDYGPSDDVLDWAGNIADANPDYNVIVTTHAYMEADGSLSESKVAHPVAEGAHNSGVEIWEKFVSRHENIVLALCGHVSSDFIVRRTDEGENGNKVVSMLLDMQGREVEYIMGMVGLFHFSEDGKTVQVEYYSTTKEKYYCARNQFTFTIDTVGNDSVVVDENAQAALGENGEADITVDTVDLSTARMFELDVTVPAAVNELSVKLTDNGGGYRTYSFTDLKEGANHLVIRKNDYTQNSGSDLSAVTGYTLIGAANAEISLEKFVASDYIEYDVNGDNAINLKDLVRAKKLAAGVTTEGKAVAIVADGYVVNSTALTAFRKFLMNIF